MIIGLHGQKQAGKDTVANYLVEHYNFERVAFADKLKDAVCALFDITREDIERWKLEPTIAVEIGEYSLESDVGKNSEFAFVKSMTFRQMLQRFGTEMGRDVFGQDFWVELLLESLDKNKDYAISDVRFLNEIAAIKNCEVGNHIIYIDRPDIVDNDTHQSEETHPFLACWTLWNDQTLDELFRQTDKMMHYFGRIKV